MNKDRVRELENYVFVTIGAAENMRYGILRCSIRFLYRVTNELQARNQAFEATKGRSMRVLLITLSSEWSHGYCRMKICK